MAQPPPITQGRGREGGANYASLIQNDYNTQRFSCLCTFVLFNSLKPVQALRHNIKLV